MKWMFIALLLYSFLSHAGTPLENTTLDKTSTQHLFATLPHDFEHDSGIRITQLTTAQQQNLAVLAKVWGFIKYYHPASAQGNVSMDAELFRLIPQLLPLSAADRDAMLINWINTLGDLQPCVQCKEATDAALIQPEQFWLDWGLSFELTQLLANVYAADLPSKHYWVHATQKAGNPVFNEKPYPNTNYQDSGFRLLTLFRLWNIIHYYSPYRDLTEQTWEQVLFNAISTVLLAKSELDYQLALAKVIYAINDTHTQLNVGKSKLLQQYIGNNIAPIGVRFVEQQAVIYKIYQVNLPIKVGDVITHINGKPLQERLEYLRPLAAASNEPTRYRNWAKWLLRDNGQQLSIQIRRNNESLQLQLPLLPLDSIKQQHSYHEHGSTAYSWLTPEIAYIRLDKIAEVDIDVMMSQLTSSKGLIIDIRNYPSKFVVFSLGKHLYPSPYAFVRFTKMQPNSPGQFNWTRQLTVGTVNPDYYQGKVAILINEHSQSQSEYTAMAFRGAPKAKVIGSTTAGADGNVSQIILPGGYKTYLSGIGVFYPDKTPTQRIGIIPDIEVNPTIAGITSGKDEILEKAVQYILND